MKVRSRSHSLRISKVFEDFGVFGKSGPKFRQSTSMMSGPPGAQYWGYDHFCGGPLSTHRFNTFPFQTIIDSESPTQKCVTLRSISPTLATILSTLATLATLSIYIESLTSDVLLGHGESCEGCES